MKCSVDPEELKRALADAPDETVVIDVRRKTDFETDPRLIPGAQWKDPEQVDDWSRELPRDKTVIVYCVRGGPVSRPVSAKPAENQVRVKYLEGGLAGWDLSAKEDR
ncbi:rhodanese-like domain-containing protein [Syntrophobacter fumaroxidans]|uniref:Rhodanese domain protein n=1 Tax=Syntrophobacter fumaroxidans (strain DSM 10017 / MPOB) TaxID=335543 RepID=A0LEE4_SYNFM|nr:rhodanese-like domain-containing protein [Syntrophobacter fumaroxidans]ABK15796.1 Rhodanese domain protein [Syntrophobacter fumaroxidans MPOB]